MPKPHPLPSTCRDHIAALVDRQGRDAVEVALLPLAQETHDYASSRSAEAAVASHLSNVLHHPEHPFSQRWHVTFEALALAYPVPEPAPEVVETSLVRFDYQGHPIFGNTTGGLVNLNDMHRAIGASPNKEPNQWARSKAVQSFIRYVASQTANSSAKSQTANSQSGTISHVYVVVPGGHHPGTWAHWQIALRYAQYLSNEFAYWCNTVIRDRLEGRGPGSYEVLGVVQSTLLAIQATLAVIQQQGEQFLRLMPGPAPAAAPTTTPASQARPLALAQLRVLVEAQAEILMRQNQYTRQQAYEGAYGYLYTQAEAEWGRRVRLHTQRSTLAHIEQIGRLQDLLDLAKRTYPEAYAACRHRIEPPPVTTTPRPSNDEPPRTQPSSRTVSGDVDWEDFFEHAYDEPDGTGTGT